MPCRNSKSIAVRFADELNNNTTFYNGRSHFVVMQREDAILDQLKELCVSCFSSAYTGGAESWDDYIDIWALRDGSVMALTQFESGRKFWGCIPKPPSEWEVSDAFK